MSATLATFAQTSITLQEAIRQSQTVSVSSQQISTNIRTIEWQYKAFLVDYKPQLTLQSTLPSFSRSYKQVVQPDGNIEFRAVRNNYSQVRLDLSQVIRKTGGTVYLTSQVQMFEDYDNRKRIFTGIPIGIGLQQPLFGFNALKWNEKIESLKYEENTKILQESLANISLKTCEQFFACLLSQADKELAFANLATNKHIYKLALLRFDMGKVSKNELLQLELEILKSEKAYLQAKSELQINTQSFNSFVGFNENLETSFQVPDLDSAFTMDSSRTLQKALENRSDLVTAKRRLQEADMSYDKALRESRFSAVINANLGLSNSFTSFGQLYSNILNQQIVSLDLSIPLIDWGRGKAKINMARVNKELIKYSNEQHLLSLVQEISTYVALFKMYKQQIQLSKKAEQVALHKYEITKEKFMLGTINTFEFSIASQEKDQGSRDYVNALRNYWYSYYYLKMLTMEDKQSPQAGTP
ncbi:TolC family protein [Xanthocytophaga agilis]|uniref:TolC family protein n=1 Tax=Xanthocytophaga agilis TaxID=3048010 RepID=A0AAE3R8T0_9BACT|nr:TolC family protein [Xanthocytophaga agilis]MDJ1505761.1 TolC family protein [Xanthocytophaga agilis]